MKNFDDEDDQLTSFDAGKVGKGLFNGGKKLLSSKIVLVVIIIAVLVISVLDGIGLLILGVKTAISDNIDHIRDGVTESGVPLSEMVDKNGNRLFDDNGNEVFSNDAGAYLDFLNRYGEYKYADEEFVLMDNATVQRVLAEVDKENQKLGISQNINYEYLVETGSFAKNYDPVTGEDIGDEIFDVYRDVEVEKINTVEVKVKPSEIIKTGNKFYDDMLEKYVEKTSGTYKVQEKEIVIEQELIEKKEDYFTDSIQIALTDMDDDINAGLGGAAYSMGYLRWQPIISFCSVYIQSHSDEWNTANFDYGNDQKYIRDTTIQEIIGLFRLKTAFAGDKVLNGGDLSFNYIENAGYGYRLSVVIENEKEPNQKKTVKRTPVLMPRRVSNAFCSFEYNYEPVEDHPGYYVLKSRTVTYQAKKFYSEMKRLLGTEEDMSGLFLELIKIQPHADDLFSYYTDLLEKSKSSEVVTFTTEDPSECSLIGCYIKSDTNPNLIGLDQSFSAGSGFTIPIYPCTQLSGTVAIDLKPGEWIVREGQTYGELWISDYATKSLLISDGFTKEEIREIINKGLEGSAGYKFNPDLEIFSSEEMIDTFAQCLYDLQTEYNISVAGLLGINIQEGGLNNCSNVYYYNYFNDTDSSYKIGSTNFADIREALKQGGMERKYSHVVSGVEDGYFDPVNGYYATAVSIYKRYFVRESGARQDTYYSMSFNGYNVEDPEHAYDNMSHCYCPPFDDNAMPYAPESYKVVRTKDGSEKEKHLWSNSNENSQGWVNGCAYARRAITNSAYGGEDVYGLLEAASMCLERPYKYGAVIYSYDSVQNSYDCSSFVCWSFTKSGAYQMPRTTAQGIYNYYEVKHIAEKVEKGEERPGDIIFFTRTNDKKDCPVTHVGIVVEPGKMIHASSSKGVIYASYNTSYYQEHFYGFIRMPIH